MMNWAALPAVAWVAFLLLEQWTLRRARESVPVRIMVTGTRGKSSLVRILAAGARAAEPATWGKVTGDVPTLLLPSGDEVIKRRAGARLAEQGWLLRRCRRAGVRCLVVEAMTITPELMKAEARLLRPTAVALVNVRDDHQETIGDDAHFQRRAYLDSIPAGVPVLTRDPTLAGLLPVAGAALSMTAAPVAAARPDLLEGLGPVQREMVLLADEVLAALGWSSVAALQAMAAAARPLAAAPRRMSWRGDEAVFLDGFSANDTESLAALWAGWREELGSDRPWSVVLATRADRPLRTRRFCAWLAGRVDIDEVYVTGSHRHAARALLRRAGVNVRDLGSEARALVPVEGSIASAVDGPCPVLVGLGNSRGLGLALRTEKSGASN